MNNKKANRILAATNNTVRTVDRKDFFGYQQIMGDGPIDFLNPVRQNAQINESYSMWIKNPLAKFIIDILIDFVWSDGIIYTAENPNVMTILNDFYHDIDNDWEVQGEKRIQDWFIYGEMLLKLFVSENAGKVKTPSVFPGNIATVKFDQNNTEKIRYVYLQNGTNEPTRYETLSFNEMTQQYEGEVIFLKINSTIHQARGLSDLFVRRDWLKLYDKSLYSTMDRIGLLLSFVWDVTIKEGKESELKEKRNKLVQNPPKPGSVRVHNEKEEWKDISPNIQGGNFDEIYRLLRSQAMAGIPEHYWGLGGDVNLATAQAMSEPFFKKAKRRQRLIKNMFQILFDYQIWQSTQKGLLKKDEDKSYTISMTEPDSMKAQSFADTILKFAQSLTVLETNGYIETDVVNSVVKMLFDYIGIDVSQGDTQEESERENGETAEPETEKPDSKLNTLYNNFLNRAKGRKHG